MEKKTARMEMKMKMKTGKYWVKWKDQDQLLCHLKEFSPETTEATWNRQKIEKNLVSKKISEN